MARQIEEIPLVAIKVNFLLKTPLYKQLYSNLRNSILEGKFSTDQKLPGTRPLARALNVSRNTVDLAFEQLLAEGYIYKKRGSGTFVSEIPDNFFHADFRWKDLRARSSDKKIVMRNQEGKPLEKSPHSKEHEYKSITKKLSKEFGSKDIISRYKKVDDIIPFQNGIPSFKDFPIKTWQRLINQSFPQPFYSNSGYGDAAGYRPLREAVASYLKTYRAVNCNAEQIIIVNGAQQGLDLITRILLKKDTKSRKVWLEDPGFFGIRASFIFAGAEVFSSPLDNEGIDINYSIKNNPVPDLIFTTPSSQFPLGLTMSISRRMKLLGYANQNNCWILEDDYDSEFRYWGNPLPSLQGLDEQGRVIYLGTFSKVMFPGLRIGYLVLPNPELIEEFATAKSLIDRQNPIFEQIVLTKFLNGGYFTRHLRKMRLLYKARQEFLINEINKDQNKILRVKPSPSGMHIIAWLPKDSDDKEIAAEAVKNNIIVRALSEYSTRYFREPGLLLGYTAFNKEEIKIGIRKLKQILN
jgi:GntR family transcriptional regulator / MocR family aminotransferase